MASQPAVPRPTRREALFLVIAMPLLFRVGFAQFFASERNLAINQDSTYQLVPIFSYMSNCFSRGDHPFWMNTIMSGIALHGDPDFSPAYPFYLLRFGLYSTPLAAMWAIHWVTVLHLLVLYMNSYVMLRCMRVSAVPALMGASVLAFSQNSISYAGWINITASYAWLPLTVGAVVLILDRRYVRGAIAMGAVSLALLILASPSQSLIHAFYVVGLLFLARAVRWFRAGDLATCAAAGRDLTLMGGFAFVLGSPSLVPVLLNRLQAIRFLGEFPPITGYARVPYEATLVAELAPIQLASLLLPYLVPNTVGAGFVGMSPVLFALFAACQRRSNWLVMPLFALAMYGMLSAAGHHFGFAQLNHHLPLLNMFREPRRHLFLFVFGVSSLAAIGFEYLVESIRTRTTAIHWRAHLGIVAIFVAVSLLALAAPLPWEGIVPPWVLLFACALTALLLFAGLWAPPPMRGLLVVSAAGLTILASLPFPPKDRALIENDYLFAKNLASHLTLQRLARIDDIRTYRILFEGDELRSAFWSMNASYYGLRSFQAFKNPLPSAWQFEEVYQRFDVRNYYPLLGARYYLCRSCERIVPGSLGRYRLDQEINGHKLYVADEAVPRYTVIGRVAGFYDTPEQFYDRVRAGFDINHEVYLDRAVLRPDLNEIIPSMGYPPRYVLKEEHSSLNKLDLSIHLERRAILMLNEYFTAAWTATVNGRTTAPIRVNLNQVGVLLDPGVNLVRLEYRPTVFIWLLRLQSVLIVVFGAVALGALARRPSRSRRADITTTE